MIGVKPRLVHGVVIIEILSPEKVAARSSITFRPGVEVMQMGGHLRNAETAILGLRWQLIEAANQDRLLIMSHDRGARKHSGVIAALVESPDGLVGNARIRCDPEVWICPQPLNVEMLWGKSIVKLEAVLAFLHMPVELATPLERASVRWVPSVVGALPGRMSKPRVRQRTREKHWRNVERIKEGCDRRAASQLALPGRTAISSPGAKAALGDKVTRTGQKAHLEKFTPAESWLYDL